MKKLVVAIGFLFLFGHAISQAKDGTAELQKTVASQPAALIYLPYSPDVTRKALDNYINKTNDKAQKNSKEYLLSDNTSIEKNNISSADLHFMIGLKDQSNQNESAVYLKLNSFSNYDDEAKTLIQFNMQDAKDYLDNLAIAIKPYASNLQLALQQKNLSTAHKKNSSLITQGNKLEQKRKKIQMQMGENENYRKDKGLAKRKTNNDTMVKENLNSRLSLSNDIAKQTVALALLKL